MFRIVIWTGQGELHRVTSAVDLVTALQASGLMRARNEFRYTLVPNTRELNQFAEWCPERILTVRVSQCCLYLDPPTATPAKEG